VQGVGSSSLLTPTKTKSEMKNGEMVDISPFFYMGDPAIEPTPYLPDSII